MYKQLKDVERVIDAGKKDSVVDTFITSYMLGLATQPYIDAEEEYATLVATEDVNDVEAVLDENDEVITDGYSPNAIRDAQIADLEAEYPHLRTPDAETVEVTKEVWDNDLLEMVMVTDTVELPVPTTVARRPEITVDIDDWKVANYKKLRKATYPTYEEFMDAWVQDDTERLDKYKADCLAVKDKHPKEKVK